MQTLEAALDEQARSNFRNAKFQLSARIVNDAPAQKMLSLRDVFADNAPLPYAQDFPCPNAARSRCARRT